jgi:hypothetical protein
MQIPKSTSSSSRFGALVRYQIKLRRLLRQFLMAMLIAALVLVSLPLAHRLTPPAQAQIIVIPPRICDPNNPGAANQIIQKCAMGEAGEYTLENTVINDLLRSHKLPQSDRSRLLGWERDAIRAGMYAKLITDIQNGVTQAAPIPALAALVKARRVLAATKALDEFNRWGANCPYIPPGPFFTYTETQCTGLAGLFGRNAPAFEEFQAYGAYLANQDIQNNPALQESAKNIALGVSLIGGLVATGVATGVLIGTGASIGALSTALFPFSGSAFSFIGVTALAAPVAAILFAVIVGVIRGIQIAGQDEIPGKLQEAKNAAMNETIDMAQLITTDNGRREVLNELLQATFPDFPATSGVPVASASDPQFELKVVGGNFGVASILQYKDWDGNTHTLRLNGGWFVDRKSGEAERLALSIKFLNGQGTKRQVSRVGSQFLITDVSDDKAAPIKGVEFEYQHPSGNPYVVRVVNTAPAVEIFGLTRRQEPPAPTTDFLGNPTTHNVSQIATIGDGQDAVELLQLDIPSENNGITLSEIKVQPDGKIMARVQPSCSATNASFNIQVTDTAGVTASKTLNVTVTPNASPVLAYAPTQGVVVGNSLTVLPTAGPMDDGGNVHKYDVFDPNPFGLGTPTITPINPTAPAFTGTVTHTTSYGNFIYLTPSGLLDIKNAGPAGSYRVDMPMTDACGLTTIGTFTLNVTCVPIVWGTDPANPTCNGASNGRITINASGGSGALKYSRDNGQTFQDSSVFDGLSAGTYNLVVKDSVGCATSSRTVILVDPTPVTFTAATTNPICNGASNGQITVNASGGTNSFTYSIKGGNFVSSNVSTGLTAGSYQIAVKDSNGCAATQTVTLTEPAPISFVPANLPNGDVATAYSAALTVSPAAGSYSFALTNGVLPPGLSLNAGGVITGTPTQNGVYNFRVTASGTGSSAGCGGFHDYQINISGCAPIAVSPATLNAATIGAPFNQTVTASPSAAYNYSVSAGALPTGLSLNAATGAITGTPQQSGSFNFTISASLGSCAGQRNYTVTVGCPAITLPALGSANLATSYTGNVAASPSGSYTYSIISGSLPGGLALNIATGAISGTPTAAGTFTFNIKAQTATGCSATQSYSLTVDCPAITLSDLATPQFNTAFNQTVAVTPAGGGYSFAVTAGSLPAGLSLNSATGAVTGTATVAGAYSFTITATRFGNCTGSRAFSGTIAGASCPTITLADLPNGAPGQMYNHSVTATPSSGYNYAVTAGSLPAGLTLYGSLGMLFGYPATAGSYHFTITATAVNNCAGSKQYSLTIGGAALRSLTFGDFDGDGKADLSVWRGQAGDWLTVASGDGQLKTEAWGSSAAPYFDVMTPGDYDGDGRMDLAVFRGQTGQWLIKGSRDGAVTAKVWGVASDIPVPGDYDGDGRTDIAVWRGAETNWYILRSSDGQTESISWGTSRAPYRDVPVAADFDGDGKTDIAVFRQSNGHWYIRQSSDGAVIDKAWGLGSDVPVAADYDGDGKADIAIWRGADSNWYVLQTSDGAVQSISWGSSSAGDVPVPGDFDGDGKADVAVWRAWEGRWSARLSRDNSRLTRTHGQQGDAPALSRTRP